ncbi:CoA transferase [Streptomyces sp. NA02950]|uniref:CoA transferase n=1 Tax=Streptomyces sp. NA02950 TaxID=2742137 RepID=UPI0015903282|nr:CoA transferase [Streptomyces sp. NA02950]QKV94485.1 CoA transferase [Streptomyces sp. NA02950]
MDHGQIDTTTADAWAALGGAPALAAKVMYAPSAGVLPARLPVRELARATVGVCSLAAAELDARRSGHPAAGLAELRVAEAAVATAFVSERQLRIEERRPVSFAPLSGFWRAADGWVRTHANYPHHRARLLATLGIPARGTPEEQVERLRAELAARPAHEAQETAYAAGALAVALAEPGATAMPLDALPLVESRPVPGPGPDAGPRPLPAAALPAEGVRVLDLTRVIAGPVATRTLAVLGADVLRIDAPRLPEDPDAHADTGFGKRSARLDLGDPADRRTFDALLARADVVVSGYRPGALDGLGLAADTLTERHPGLIVAELCAWGWSGPWTGRRGFDSLVQVATGIAALEAGPDGRPGVLPAQALDHGTGYLIAAAVLRALTARQDTGAGRRLRFSLAGTASWLMHGVTPAPEGGPEYDPAPWLAETESPYGALRYARSPLVRPGGGGFNWSRPPGRWGADTPRWR